MVKDGELCKVCILIAINFGLKFRKLSVSSNGKAVPFFIYFQAPKASYSVIKGGTLSTKVCRSLRGPGKETGTRPRVNKSRTVRTVTHTKIGEM